MEKKLYQLRTVKGKKEEEQLVAESEEIIQLAHKTNYHQRQVYGEILYNLAMLSDRHSKESELVRVSEEILAISPANPLSIGWYFLIISWLMDVGELVKVEELLALMEAWPEETFTQQYQ